MILKMQNINSHLHNYEFSICQIKKKHFNRKDIFYIQNLIMDIKLSIY